MAKLYKIVDKIVMKVEIQYLIVARQDVHAPLTSLVLLFLDV